MSLETFLSQFTSLVTLHNRRMMNNFIPIVSKPLSYFNSVPDENLGLLDGYGLIKEDCSAMAYPLLNDHTLSQEMIEKIVRNVESLKAICLELLLIGKLRSKSIVLLCCPWTGLIMKSSTHEIEMHLRDFSRKVVNPKKPLTFAEALIKSCKIHLVSKVLEKLAQTYDVPNNSGIIERLLLPFDVSYKVNKKNIQKIVNTLGICLILVSGSTTCPLQTVLAEEVLCTTPIFIAMDDNGFYLTCIHQKEDLVPLRKQKGCSCGRNTKMSACLPDSKCPCSTKGLSCNEDPMCHCLRCGNVFGQKNIPLKKTASCKCKIGTCNNSTCRCFKASISCFDQPM